MSAKPRGHGYTIATVDKENPFFETGTVIKGHEFHYSGPMDIIDTRSTCMQIETGSGIANKRDGLLFNNCFASYTHIHADSVNEWAGSLVRSALSYKKGKKNEKTGTNNLAGVAP